MKTAVLIHGYHLDSKLQVGDRTYDWYDLAIGSDPSMQGRASHGVRVAYRERADAVIFSTGASEKDGLKEAAYTYREVRAVAQEIGAPLGLSGKELQSWLQARVHLDIESQTTSEELTRNLGWCRDNRISRVILVTSRFHVPRALANANDAAVRLGIAMTILGTAPQDPSPAPVIFEPPTRPDRASTDFRPTLSRLFLVPADRQEAARAEIEAVLARYTG